MEIGIGKIYSVNEGLMPSSTLLEFSFQISSCCRFFGYEPSVVAPLSDILKALERLTYFFNKSFRGCFPSNFLSPLIGSLMSWSRAGEYDAEHESGAILLRGTALHNSQRRTTTKKSRSL
jgi:hypothetical protein